MSSSKKGENRRLFMRARSYMRGAGLPANEGWEGLAPRLEALAKKSQPEFEPKDSTFRTRGKAAIRVLDGKEAPRVGKKRTKKDKDVNSVAFLRGYEWRKLRMTILKKYGARCQCCGQTAQDGITINIDHIKPRKKYPELALTEDNLQVLCHECNHGKGNWDETDWREPRLAVLMGEAIA